MPKKKRENVIRTTEDLMKIKKKFEERSRVEFKYEGTKYIFRLRRPLAERVKGLDLDIFKATIKPEHAGIMRKISAGEELTDEEKKILESENPVGAGNLLSAKVELDKILARLLEPPEDENEALGFWETVPFAFGFVAYLKLIDAIGISEESFEKVRKENPDVKLIGLG